MNRKPNLSEVKVRLWHYIKSGDDEAILGTSVCGIIIVSGKENINYMYTADSNRAGYSLVFLWL